VQRSQSFSALGAIALVGAVAELAVRLLSPRETLADPERVDLGAYFSAEEITRGRSYARGQRAIGAARALLDAATLTAIVARARRRSTSATPDRDRRSRTAGGTPGLVAGAAMGAGLAVSLSLPGLPLAALARRRALAVGLATQSWRDWSIDLVKATAIQGTASGAGGAAATAAMGRWPRAWWIPATGGSVLFGGLLATLAPIVLDPIFNTFTELPDGQIRSEILALADAAGVSVGRVYSVDASRRTTAANAYVTGLGPTKRVVLFDTLLERFTHDEIRVVVAHELAHVRHRDVSRGLAFAAITAPVTMLAAQRITGVLVADGAGAGALPALVLSLGIASFPVSLSVRRLSRRLERRADAYSLQLSGAPEAFVGFERTIALQNVADVDPPRIVRLLSTHPSTGERIGAALTFAKAPR
jgi:STE24 endopeptidase